MTETHPSGPTCPHCGSSNVIPTKPGCLADVLFLVSMLFVMSPLQKGELYHCNACNRNFREE